MDGQHQGMGRSTQTTGVDGYTSNDDRVPFIDCERHEAVYDCDADFRLTDMLKHATPRSQAAINPSTANNGTEIDPTDTRLNASSSWTRRPPTSHVPTYMSMHDLSTKNRFVCA